MSKYLKWWHSCTGIHSVMKQRAIKVCLKNEYFSPNPFCWKKKKIVCKRLWRCYQCWCLYKCMDTHLRMFTCLSPITPMHLSSCPSQNFSYAYHTASMSQWRNKSCFLIMLMGNCLIMTSISHLIWSFSSMAQWSTKLHQSLSFVSLIILSLQLSNSFQPYFTLPEKEMLTFHIRCCCVCSEKLTN